MNRKITLDGRTYEMSADGSNVFVHYQRANAVGFTSDGSVVRLVKRGSKRDAQVRAAFESCEAQQH